MVQIKWPAFKQLFIGCASLIILIGGLGTWATQTQIAGAIVANGKIEVEQNRQVVQHPEGGVVIEILVNEGDMVNAGDILIRLDPSQLASQLQITEGQLFEHMARRGRLEAERDGTEKINFDNELIQRAQTTPAIKDQISGQQRLLKARRASIAKEIEQLGKRRLQTFDQITGIEAQAIAIETQINLIQQELSNQKTLLGKGLAQIGKVLTLQREEARLYGLAGELKSERAQAQGRIIEIDLEVLKLENYQREEAISHLRDLRSQELELVEQRRNLKERLTRLDIRAPVSGIVYDMQVFAEQSVIRPAASILHLVPQDRTLVIMAQVEPIHVDELYINQDVTLRFSALDASITPELFGRVAQVSADVFNDEISSLNYYRAEIRLNEGEAARLPEKTILIPGMPVEAYIRTSERAPLVYLLKPLTDYFSKAFR